MTKFDISQLRTSPIYVNMTTLLATLQAARVQVDAISGTTVTIEFKDETERAAFLEAVKFAQAGPKTEAK